MSKELEMIKLLMDDYIEEANKPKSKYWYPNKGNGELNKSKLKRIRLIIQEKMLELEKGIYE